MKLDPEDHAAIAQQVAELLRAPAPMVVDLDEAMRRSGFKSDTAFHRWARRIGLGCIRGAQGRYAVHSINQAIDRAARLSRRVI